MSASGQLHMALLERRRQVLLARSARLRDELADDARAVLRPLGAVDRGVSIARSGLLKPALVAGGAMLLVAGRALAFWPVIRPFVPQIVAFVRAQRRAD
jgi:hypothetical protein